jgi:hypothetical protein
VVAGAYGKSNFTGAAYVFTRSGTTWTQQQKLTASDPASNDLFGVSVSVSGDTVVAGAYGKSGSQGAAYFFTRSGTTWTQQQKLTASDAATNDLFGISVSVSGDTVVVGAYGENNFTGAAYVFTASTVTIQSDPPGRAFSVSGAGCASGSFSTPQTFGNGDGWTPLASCTVTFVSPDNSTPGTHYTFQSWDDGPTANPRTIVVPQSNAITYYTGDFTTQYDLQVTANPPAGGIVTGAGTYFAGLDATVTAAPNPGYVFTGFSGAIIGPTTPQIVLMNAPQTVTANFAVAGPATLSGLISAKAGPSGARVWTLTLSNSGTSAAYVAQINVLMLVQTFGTACLPVRISPPMLPLNVGTVAPGGTASGNVTLNFSGCAANARFNATIGYGANGGSAGGASLLANQFQ